MLLNVIQLVPDRLVFFPNRRERFIVLPGGMLRRPVLESVALKFVVVNLTWRDSQALPCSRRAVQDCLPQMRHLTKCKKDPSLTLEPF